MKSNFLLVCTLAIAAFLSSCQKDNQTPSKPEADLQNANIELTNLNCSIIGNTLNKGLIAFYPFHGNANDESGHGHNGVFSATMTPTLTTNKYGIPNEAYNFNKTSIITVNTLFNTHAEQKQFSFYVRCKSNTIGALLCIGDAYDSTKGSPYFVLETSYGILQLPSPGKQNGIGVLWTETPGNGGAVIESFLPSFCENSWMDLVVNYSNSVLTLYVNGKLAGTATTGFPAPARLGSGLLIGALYAHGYPTFFYNSAIDEIRVYKRPLSTDEINYLLTH